jgi:hypothetical protein
MNMAKREQYSGYAPYKDYNTYYTTYTPYPKETEEEAAKVNDQTFSSLLEALPLHGLILILRR